jgi:hypothetical protein
MAAAFEGPPVLCAPLPLPVPPGRLKPFEPPGNENWGKFRVIVVDLVQTA